MRLRCRAQLGEDGLAADIGEMEVEQDELRSVLARELDAEAALHCGDQVHVVPVVEDVFDELDVGEVVLDVEDRVLFAGSRSCGLRDGRAARSSLVPFDGSLA